MAGAQTEYECPLCGLVTVRDSKALTIRTICSGTNMTWTWLWRRNKRDT